MLSLRCPDPQQTLFWCCQQLLLLVLPGRVWICELIDCAVFLVLQLGYLEWSSEHLKHTYIHKNIQFLLTSTAAHTHSLFCARSTQRLFALRAQGVGGREAQCASAERTVHSPTLSPSYGEQRGLVLQNLTHAGCTYKFLLTSTAAHTHSLFCARSTQRLFALRAQGVGGREAQCASAERTVHSPTLSPSYGEQRGLVLQNLTHAGCTYKFLLTSTAAHTHSLFCARSTQRLFALRAHTPPIKRGRAGRETRRGPGGASGYDQR